MFTLLCLSHASRDIFPVEIETDISRGIFRFDIIGLGDKAVEESKLRVLSAIKNSGFKTPNKSNQKVTVLLSPAHKKKEGSHFDLAIALSYLMHCQMINVQYSQNIEQAGLVAIGELSLQGLLRPVKHIIEYVYKAQNLGFTYFILPKENQKDIQESGIAIETSKICFAASLPEAIYHIEQNFKDAVIFETPKESESGETDQKGVRFDIDLINGQDLAKRALEICLTGKHHMILTGPPGIGKTFLAKSAEQLIPPRNQKDILERSISLQKGTHVQSLIIAPHHTSSYAALIGGDGKIGKVMEADGGILLFDEWSEFDRRALESMRQPLEEGEVDGISSDFILIATTNPCPCGYHETTQGRCICKASRLSIYQHKVSGPLLDRIDLFINLGERYESESKLIDGTEIKAGFIAKTKSGQEIKDSITRVRYIQAKRIEKMLRVKNIQESAKLNRKALRLKLAQFILKEMQYLSESGNTEAYKIYEILVSKYKFNLRKSDTLLLIARTIADIEKSDHIRPEHLIEASSYRNKKA